MNKLLAGDSVCDEARPSDTDGDRSVNSFVFMHENCTRTINDQENRFQED